MFKTIQILFIGIVATLLLTACGPSEQEIKDLGFVNAAEMKEIQAKGFKTKEDFVTSEAKRLGWDSVAEMKALQAQGFNSVKEYNEHMAKAKEEYAVANESAKQAGWESQSEKELANNKGFSSPKEYHALLAREETKRQKEQKDQEHIKDKDVNCYMYRQALDACATAFDTNKCLNIKLYGDAYKYRSACY